jgi:hypothetical protein
MYCVLLCIPEYKVDRLLSKVADNAGTLAASMHNKTLMQWEVSLV